jgi:pimeloyl-ACP methyl ester carboxylesterase
MKIYASVSVVMALALPAATALRLPAATALRVPPSSLVMTVATSTAVDVGPLTWSESADNTWLFDGGLTEEPLTVNYIAAGPESGQPMLLVHGFGASGFHWRRNVNALAAEGYRVYAIDLLGFGLSSKPIMEYDAEKVWVGQCAAFLREVAGCGGAGGRRALIAGNSIGGYTALATAAAHPELVLGIASLNGAGRFSPSGEEAAALAALEAQKAARSDLRVAVDDALAATGAAIARSVAYLGLLVTKQPLRIKQVLRQVYPVRPEAADDELVASIVYPADDAPGLAPPGGIPEVFYRIVSRNGRGGAKYVDELLEELQVPLLLLWGASDPWIVKAIGDRMQASAVEKGVDVRRVSVNAGQ